MNDNPLQISCLLVCFICDVNITSLYFQQDTHHFRFCSTRHVATELTRPQSGGLGHLACHSATCAWQQSSWHRWAATASAACVVQLEAVADWWCSWPMPNTLCVLVFVPEAEPPDPIISSRGEGRWEGMGGRRVGDGKRWFTHPCLKCSKIPWSQNWSDWRGRQHRRLPRAANTVAPPLALRCWRTP